MDYVTCGDHALIGTEMQVEELLGRISIAEVRKKKITRTVYEYDKATQENWQEDLYQYLCNKPSIN